MTLKWARGLSDLYAASSSDGLARQCLHDVEGVPRRVRKPQPDAQPWASGCGEEPSTNPTPEACGQRWSTHCRTKNSQGRAAGLDDLSLATGRSSSEYGQRMAAHEEADTPAILKRWPRVKGNPPNGPVSLREVELYATTVTRGFDRRFVGTSNPGMPSGRSRCDLRHVKTPAMVLDEQANG